MSRFPDPPSPRNEVASPPTLPPATDRLRPLLPKGRLAQGWACLWPRPSSGGAQRALLNTRRAAAMPLWGAVRSPSPTLVLPPCLRACSVCLSSRRTVPPRGLGRRGTVWRCGLHTGRQPVPARPYPLRHRAPCSLGSLGLPPDEPLPPESWPQVCLSGTPNREPLTLPPAKGPDAQATPSPPRASGFGFGARDIARRVLAQPQ